MRECGYGSKVFNEDMCPACQVKQKPTLKGIDKFKSPIHEAHGIEGLQELLNSL